jgi:hypothetical protein
MQDLSNYLEIVNQAAAQTTAVASSPLPAASTLNSLSGFLPRVNRSLSNHE